MYFFYQPIIFIHPKKHNILEEQSGSSKLIQNILEEDRSSPKKTQYFNPSGYNLIYEVIHSITSYMR